MEGSHNELREDTPSMTSCSIWLPFLLRKRRRRLGSHQAAVLPHTSVTQSSCEEREGGSEVSSRPEPLTASTWTRVEGAGRETEGQTPSHWTGPHGAGRETPSLWTGGCGAGREVLSGFEEDDLLSGICPEDFSFSLNTSTGTGVHGLHPPPHIPKSTLHPSQASPHPSQTPSHPSPVPLLTSSPAMQPSGHSFDMTQNISGEAGCGCPRAIPPGNEGLHTILEGGNDMDLGQDVHLIPESPPLGCQNGGEVKEGGVRGGDVAEGGVREGEMRDEQVREREEEGTFFGLPVKVQALLEEHRGVHSLYGKSSL